MTAVLEKEAKNRVEHSHPMIIISSSVRVRNSFLGCRAATSTTRFISIDSLQDYAGIITDFTVKILFFDLEDIRSVNRAVHLKRYLEETPII